PLPAHRLAPCLRQLHRRRCAHPSRPSCPVVPPPPPSPPPPPPPQTRPSPSPPPKDWATVPPRCRFDPQQTSPFSSRQKTQPRNVASHHRGASPSSRRGSSRSRESRQHRSASPCM